MPWDDKFAVEDKHVCVRCRRIPLKFWNKQCFEQVATLVGSLVEVEIATLEQEVLEYARLKVRVPLVGEARTVHNVEQGALMSPNPSGMLEDLDVGYVCVSRCIFIC